MLFWRLINETATWHLEFKPLLLTSLWGTLTWYFDPPYCYLYSTFRCASLTVWLTRTSWLRSSALTSALLPPWRPSQGIKTENFLILTWLFIHFDNFSIFRGDNNFCLTITDSGRLKLKEDHPYYYQVLSINDFIFITALLIEPLP